MILLNHIALTCRGAVFLPPLNNYRLDRNFKDLILKTASVDPWLCPVRLWFKISAMLIGIMLFTSTGWAENTHDYIYLASDDDKPFAYIEKKDVRGIAVDVLRLLWKDMGIHEQPIIFLPWARAYKYLKKKERHVLIGIARSPERERMFKWVGPYATVRFGVFALKKHRISITNFSDLNAYTIGTVRGDLVEELLRQGGFTGQKESVTRNMQNIKKLLINRIDLVACLDLSLYSGVRKAQLNPNDFESLFVLKEFGAFYGFHKKTPDSLIQEFQASLERQKDKVQVIVNEY